MRTVSFGLLFFATCLHILDQNYSFAAWGFLGALLLVYPHLQYWRASRSDSPVKEEMRNLLVDSALLGIYIATVKFSLWLSFSALIGTLINNAVNKGWRGLRQAVLALLAGMLLGAAVAGFGFAPATSWAATVFCMLGLSGYLMALGNIGYARNVQLRTTREVLRGRESELLAANEALLKNLREIDQLHQQVREQATLDPLTGLYNRRYLDSTLERELARCKRDGQPLSLIMIDIDHFKRINDTYGHQAGDAVLKSLGAILHHAARREDVACRYGGEEFLLVMPTMSLGAARERAEDLRQSFGSTTVEFGSFRLKASLSIGVAIFPGHGSVAEDLIRCADKALYLAKQEGRNQVRVAPGGEEDFPADGKAPANIVQLVWQRAYESGHASLDQQHRALFAQVNTLLAALLANRPTAEIGGLIQTLVGDIGRHFAEEEAIITAAACPGAAQHALLHGELKARAFLLLRQFEANQLDVWTFFQFLAHDLIARHMLVADREFFPCLDEAAQHGKATRPLASAN